MTHYIGVYCQLDNIYLSMAAMTFLHGLLIIIIFFIRKRLYGNIILLPTFRNVFPDIKFQKAKFAGSLANEFCLIDQCFKPVLKFIRKRNAICWVRNDVFVIL